MTPERWQELSNVLYQALELAPEHRPAFLDRACASDTTLRREIESLLSASDEMRPSFLKSSSLAMTIKPGTRLDDYEVETLIGSGGMGEVYRARDTRLKRAVAIKVLPDGIAASPEGWIRTTPETLATAIRIGAPVNWRKAVAAVRDSNGEAGTVTDDEIADAIRAYWTDTHNLVEGAGAAPLAALLQERARMAGKRVGVVISGGNIDLALFRSWVLG